MESLPNILEREGGWTADNSKGTYRILTDHFQAFMKNPGYQVTVKEMTKLRCYLRPSHIQEDQEVPSLSICVYEILENNRFRIY
jgi:hypothetical protein